MSGSAGSPSSAPPAAPVSTPPPKDSGSNSGPPPSSTSPSPPSPTSSPSPPSSTSPPSPSDPPPSEKPPPAPPPSNPSPPPKSTEAPRAPPPSPPPAPTTSPSVPAPSRPTGSPSSNPPATASPPPPEDQTPSTPSPPPPDSNASPPPPTTSAPDSQPTNPTTPSESTSPPPSVSPNAPKTPPSPVQVPAPKGTPTTPQPTPSSSHVLPPPGSSSEKTSKHQPPGSPADGGNLYGQKTMVGITVAGVVIIALLAILFVVRRRKKRRMDAYSNPSYLPPPNFSVKSDGHFYGHNHAMPYSGQGGSMYNSQQHSSGGNSSGSQRGYMPSGGTSDSGVISGNKTIFSYEELMDITNGFSRQNILGEGGFGCVYKGCFPDGKVVAVKQLKAGSGQGEREFKAEVEIISRVHHRHLVSLVGYCISDQHRLLIYEFVPNKTLEHHLHGKGMPVLEWAKRLKIAIGSAKGLAYLHEDCHPKIIHRDIKSANILLHDDFEAQVADFGLARLNDTTQTHVSTRVMGTFGYLAPEYASSGKLTDRSDVFSFGVVLLELITGRKPVDPNQPLGEESLVEWARPMLIQAIETGDFSQVIDPRLEKHYVEHEVFRMIETAAACVRHSAPKRPRMAQVVRALDSEGEMSDLNNGVKVGQSTVYDSGQYSQDISKFRRMAFGFDDSSDSALYSGDHSVRSSRRSQGTSSEYTSNESETRAFNTRRF